MLTRLLPLCLGVALVTTACAEPPHREMDQAQGAIDAARAAGAEQYAPTEYTAAADALDSANEAVGIRDYRLALNHALESLEQAQTAARVAAEARARLRGELERAFADLTASHVRIRAQLEAVQGTRRGTARALAPAVEELAVAAESLQEASAAIDAENYPRVTPILQRIREQLDYAADVIESVTS